MAGGRGNKSSGGTAAGFVGIALLVVAGFFNTLTTDFGIPAGFVVWAKPTPTRLKEININILFFMLFIC